MASGYVMCYLDEDAAAKLPLLSGHYSLMNPGIFSLEPPKGVPNQKICRVFNPLPPRESTALSRGIRDEV